MKIESELQNAVKKLLVVEGNLKRTFSMIQCGDYGEGLGPVRDDVSYALDKIALAREALKNHLPEN